MDRTSRGSQFRRWRQGAGLSQGDVADEFGIKRAAVALWESGRSMPTRPKWPALAELYGIPVDDIAALKTKPQYPKQPAACERCGFADACRILGRDGLPAVCEEPEDVHLRLMRESGTLQAFQRLRQQYQKQNGGQSEEKARN